MVSVLNSMSSSRDCFVSVLNFTKQYLVVIQLILFCMNLLLISFMYADIQTASLFFSLSTENEASGGNNSGARRKSKGTRTHHSFSGITRWYYPDNFIWSYWFLAPGTFVKPRYMQTETKAPSKVTDSNIMGRNCMLCLIIMLSFNICAAVSHFSVSFYINMRAGVFCRAVYSSNQCWCHPDHPLPE